jgi:transposase
MAQRLDQELVLDGLWEIVEPLLPAQRERPQGGGTRQVDDRAVFTAIVHVLTTGCAWRHLPAEFGFSKATAHRRFVAWTQAGLWRRLHGRCSTGSVSKRRSTGPAVVDAASVWAKKGVR